MKLDDLFSFPFLHISEAPIIGPPQPLGLKDPKILSQLEPTSQTIEGFDLYAKKFGDEIVFAIQKGKEILTILIGKEITDFPGEKRRASIFISRSWTPEHLRGEGYSLALYDGLASLGYRIVSDRQISNNAQKVWDKLSRKRRLKFFDWKTKQYTEENPKNNPDISYVLEHVTFKIKSKLIEDTKLWTV